MVALLHRATINTTFLYWDGVWGGDFAFLFFIPYPSFLDVRVRYMLPSVCLSSVCRRLRSCKLLRRSKFSAIFLRHLVRWPSLDIHKNFYGDRPWETPQISTGFASWLRYCTDVAQRRTTKLCFAGCFAVSCRLIHYIHFRGTRAAAVSQALWRDTSNGITELSQRTPLIFGWAAITLGTHSSYILRES